MQLQRCAAAAAAATANATTAAAARAAAARAVCAKLAGRWCGGRRSAATVLAALAAGAVTGACPRLCLETLKHQRIAHSMDSERDGARRVQETKELLHVLRRRDEVDAVTALRERRAPQLTRHRGRRIQVAGCAATAVAGERRLEVRVLGEHAQHG